MTGFGLVEITFWLISGLNASIPNHEQPSPSHQHFYGISTIPSHARFMTFWVAHGIEVMTPPKKEVDMGSASGLRT